MNKETIINKIIIQPDGIFDLKETLFSGQSFRWSQIDILEPYHATVIGKRILLIKEITAGYIEVLCSDDSINGMSISDFIGWYFSLDIDVIKALPENFCADFPEVWRLLKPYSGVRILRQNPFEIIVTFMCAQGIGMHLIRRQVSMIAERYGEQIVLDTPQGDLIFHTFPTPLALASADPSELSRCTNNNRVRAANIITMARSFESDMLTPACVLSDDSPLVTVLDTLCTQSGIGMKIADCIALFGLGRFDAFPIDTHVKQYLWEWFGIEAAQHTLTGKNYRHLQDEARKILGNNYAGYAGHLLFHCWRKEIKKMKAF
jgi:N-glycosylase/DNA lyase